MRKIYIFLYVISFIFLGHKAQSQCASIPVITCGTPNTAVLTGAGSWNVTSCGFSTPGAEAVYSFTPTVTGSYVLQITAATGGFVDYFYKAASGGCSATGWTCIDDNSAAGTDPIGTLTAGTEYYILLDAEGTGSRTHTFQINCFTPPPANDLCSGALPIACGQTITGSTSAATLDAVGTCGTALGTAPGVWYTMAGDGSTTTLSLCGSGYDTKIGVFSGSCASLTCVIGNDDFCGTGSQVTFTANAGTTYYILVTGFSTNSGNYTLTRTCVFPCSGVPSPGSISGPAGAVCAGSNITLTLTGFTTGVTGISYQWKSSPTAGGPYTNIAGATNTTYTGPAGPNRFYVCTVTCANGGGNATTAEFAVTVNSPVHSNLSATPATTCSPGSSTLTGTVSGGVTTGGSGVIVSSGTINLAIPDNSAAGANTSLTVPASTNITAAADLKIRINANHTWVGDLKFTLTSPCGTTFLFDRPGVPAGAAGNSDNLGTATGTTPPPGVYTFDLAGATVIPETNAGPGFIAPGTYRPSDVNGAAHNWAGLTFPCAAAGTWTLNVSDNAGLDQGTLVDWAIIGPTSGNYTHTLTGPGTIGAGVFTGANNGTATYNVTNVPAGTHTYTLTSTDVTGCSVSSPITLTVNPTPVITITPANSTICAGGVQQINAGAAPAATQTYSSGTINLAIPDNSAGGVNTAPVVLPSGINITSASGLRVRINARHSWVGDLKFTLTSPCGTTFLFDRPGVPATTVGNSANLGTSNATTPPPAVYIFDLAAATVIPETAPGTGFIPTGSYRPSDAAGAAHSWAGVTFPCSAAGNWILNISDNAAGDNGVLVDWAVLYDAPLPVIFSPATGLFTDASATTPYVAGTPVNTVWASPATTTTYTANTTLTGCSAAPVTHIVTVNQLPAITAQPVAPAAPVCPGVNVNFSVTATGAGLNYQWQVSTDNGTTWNNAINGAQYINVTTTTMTALNVQNSQNGYRFRVIVGGTCPPAVTSSSVTLVVAAPPTITTQPASLTRCEGTSATFSVVAAGVPTPTIYQWQVSTDGGTTYTNIATGTTASYTIPAVTNAMNNNRYRVIVTNNCGQNITSSAAVLTVNALSPVSITALPTRICLSDTLVALNATPVGGSWSGIGVSGFNFLPGITAVGTYNLTYTYVNPAGCTSSAAVAARVEDCPERIRLLRNDGALLYPNPNSGQFFIKVNSTLYEYLGMTVYSTSGQRVYQRTFNGLVYGRVIPVNITHLPAGTYMVKVFYDDGENTGEKTFTVVVGR